MINELKLKILVCDDDSDDLGFIADAVSELGMDIPIELFEDVVKFEDSFTAVGNVALLDHRLGGVLGWEIMDRISRKTSLFIRPAFIIISGNHDPHVYTEYTRRGIFGYVDKNKKHTFKKEVKEFTQSAVSKMIADVEYYQTWVKNP